MPRFSLNWFLAAIAFAGLVIAVLHRPQWYLTATLAMIVWGALVVATMTVVLCGVRARPFAFGFALAGLSFLITSVLPYGWNPLSDLRAGVNAISYPVHRIVVPALARRLAEPGETVARRGDDFVFGNGRRTYQFYQEFERTEITVRLALAMLIGCLGGWIAGVIRGRKLRTEVAVPITVGRSGP